MFHGINNDFLYAAYRLEAQFGDDIGNNRSITGTCFFVLNKFNTLCLITNRHMLDFQYTNKDESLRNVILKKIIIYGKEKEQDTNLPNLDISILPNLNIIYDSDYNNDVACINCGQILALRGNRIDFFIPYKFFATEEDFKKNLSVCDFLAFPGFPQWYDKQGNRPILRTGTISSDPRYDYSYGDNVRGACVAYEAFSYGGSSGSPIFAVQKGPEPGVGICFPGFRRLMFIGINAGHLNLSSNGFHSGISYFYKSTIIDRLINF